MKNKSIIKAAAIAATLGISGTAANAATIVDQVNDANQNVTFSANFNWQQKVTAGVTGILQQIELNFGGGSGSLNVYINLGTGWQTDLNDYSTSVSGQSGWTTFDVSAANIALTGGDVFSIGISGSSGSQFLGSNGDTYAGGVIYFEGAPYSQASFDMNFRTSVAQPAPVPLPAGLPLMIAGLGAFAFMRRKNKP